MSKVRIATCKKTVDGTRRLHTWVEKVDGVGRKFKTCNKCGAVYVRPN